MVDFSKLGKRMAVSEAKPTPVRKSVTSLSLSKHEKSRQETKPFKLNVSATPKTKVITKPFSLKPKTTPKTKTTPKSSPLASILHGTGMTKKLVTKAINAQNTRTIQTNKLLNKVNNQKTSIKSFTQPELKIKAPQSDQATLANIELDESQTRALNILSKAQYGVMVGAAGTGKTTVTRMFVDLIKDSIPTMDMREAIPNGLLEYASPINAPSIAFMAFTGRAVQQMKKALPSELHAHCQTINATLGYRPEYELVQNPKTGMHEQKMRFRPFFNQYNKLPYKVIIIDEAGMLSIEPLWHEILDAILPDTRIYQIGDINQLVPVQGRSVLGFAMIKWPTATLETIHRQAAGNPIIARAHDVLQGRIPQTDPKHFLIIKLEAGSRSAFNTLLVTVKKLHQKGVFDPMQDAIIVPKNEGTLGQENINQRLVYYFNPEKKIDDAVLNPRTIIYGVDKTPAFAVGDKVMLLQNDRKRNLTNGMIGIVESINENPDYKGKFATEGTNLSLSEEDFESFHDTTIDPSDTPKDEKTLAASHIMRVRMEPDTPHEQTIEFTTRGQFANIRHAYAFTCHKSQGGQYRTVVIVVHSADSVMLCREWLYTAITRATDRVVILCNDQGLIKSVRTQRIKGNTVQEKAQAFMRLQGRSDVTVPRLPEPRDLD